MGQKTNPISNRIGITRGWDSNWVGGKDAPINGTLKLYAIDLKTGAKTLVGEAVADDAKFASGDTATFAFETSATAQFYKAVIVAE